MQQGNALVVGFGNELRGDDGVGQVVARALWSERHCAPALAGTEFVWSAQLVPEIALDVSRSDLAIFVDAAYDDALPGSVHVSPLDNEVTPQGGVGFLNDALGCWADLSPAGLLSLSAELYGAAPPAALVTVSVDVPLIGVGLSPVVRDAVPVAVRAVVRAITFWRGVGKPVPQMSGRALNA
jgi:hydrogenase maturation protease